MDSTGNIIEHISNKGNDRNFNDAIKQIKEKYEVASCKRFEQYAIAKSYSAVEDKKYLIIRNPKKKHLIALHRQ